MIKSDKMDDMIKLDVKSLPVYYLQSGTVRKNLLILVCEYVSVQGNVRLTAQHFNIYCSAPFVSCNLTSLLRYLICMWHVWKKVWKTEK